MLLLSDVLSPGQNKIQHNVHDYIVHVVCVHCLKLVIDMLLNVQRNLSNLDILSQAEFFSVLIMF